MSRDIVDPENPGSTPRFFTASRYLNAHDPTLPRKAAPSFPESRREPACRGVRGARLVSTDLRALGDRRTAIRSTSEGASGQRPERGHLLAHRRTWRTGELRAQHRGQPTSEDQGSAGPASGRNQDGMAIGNRSSPARRRREGASPCPRTRASWIPSGRHPPACSRFRSDAHGSDRPGLSRRNLCASRSRAVKAEGVVAQ